jgi:topoisomerase-4 subunit B
MAKAYTESAIQTLDALTHIRLRSGMYIGRLGDGSHADDGIYILLKEVLDNSVDEFIMGHGTEIDVSVDFAEGRVQVRDFGRGIPLGKLVDCVSRINTGAKYNDDVFQFSVGLNGVGTKAVNALSSLFIVQSFRDGESKRAVFERGILLEEQSVKKREPNGTYVCFVPDQEIFKRFHYDDGIIRKRLWNTAYLHTGLIIRYNGEKIESTRGLLDLLEAEVPSERLYEPLHFKSKMLEFALVHTQSFSENYFSFVNGQHTADGGTHLSAFREGVLKAVNEYAKKSYQGDDVREGLVAAVAVKVKDPVFESQTKNKLGNAEIRAPLVAEVREAVLELLYKNTETANKILERVAFNEKLRKELAGVKKEAREKAKRISYKIPQLRDCRYHFNSSPLHGGNSQIFLTEGESAAASIVSSRDPHTQAVFALRGKPLNVFGMKRDQLYRNEEMYNLMSTLGVENDLEGLRYSKVILATDADVDGMHIRNLLITFFLTYFESLAVNGHLYVLETPLFKVRFKDKTHYCFSLEEKEALLKHLGKSAEVTRFKGLGEISPKEFKQFIGPEMRLTPISIGSLGDIRPTLEFYMGRNTPERKSFIMQNLVADLVSGG